MIPEILTTHDRDERKQDLRLVFKPFYIFNKFVGCKLKTKRKEALFCILLIDLIILLCLLLYQNNNIIIYCGRLLATTTKIFIS